LYQLEVKKMRDWETEVSLSFGPNRRAKADIRISRRVRAATAEDAEWLAREAARLLLSRWVRGRRPVMKVSVSEDEDR
jgi:hypothetical protein